MVVVQKLKFLNNSNTLPRASGFFVHTPIRKLNYTIFRGSNFSGTSANQRFDGVWISFSNHRYWYMMI
jgi:hypothetical protein